MYSPEQISYILYNNRSLEGTVVKFLPGLNLDVSRLIEYEGLMNYCQRFYDEERTVEVNTAELNMEAPDVCVGPEDVQSCLEAVMTAHVALMSGGPEYDWLVSRGITREMMVAERLGSLSYLAANYPEVLTPLGITIHPTLSGFISDDISDGGIIIPLLRRNRHKSWRLVNCTTRRISDVGKLKYTQACPELHVWGGLNTVGPYWICEGLFDAAAMRQHGFNAVSVSSAMWTAPQLMQLVRRSTEINIFVDNDRVGLRSGAVMKRFFGMLGIPCRTYMSEVAKDPCEHFMELGLGADRIVEIEITRDMIGSYPDMTFNLTKYLKNRTF